jgi:hypothetical protein
MKRYECEDIDLVCTSFECDAATYRTDASLSRTAAYSLMLGASGVLWQPDWSVLHSRHTALQW